MIDVLICHAEKDRATAEIIADQLRRTTEAHVWCDGLHAGHTVLDAWQSGMSMTAVLLALSADSVPAKLDRAEWEDLIEHRTGNQAPPVGILKLGECKYPALLERSRFFRWVEKKPAAALREMQRWLIGLHAPGASTFEPAHLARFEGQGKVMETLWSTLVDGAGAAALVGGRGAGKTAVAQEFAREARAYFRDTLWVDCAGRTAGWIADETAAQLGRRRDSIEEDAWEETGTALARHRVLVVFDDLEEPLPLRLGADARVAALATTRGPEACLRGARVIEMEGEDRGAVERPQQKADEKLWQAMGICRRNGFPFDLAAEIAGLDADAARAARVRLIEGGLLEPWDAASARDRMSVRAWAAAGKSLRRNAELFYRRHAEVLHAVFSKRAEDPERCRRYAGEIETALLWACGVDWQFAVELGMRAFAFLKADGRLTAGVDVLNELRREAERREDQRVLEDCEWEMSWLRGGAPAARGAAGEESQLAFEF